MKTNEAPEKIYVTECMLFATNPEITLPKNDSIEYTRTDAFIEKAEKYLRENFIKDVSILSMGLLSINFAPAISNFLKYMKGE